MGEIIKRPEYYNYQFLFADDFNEEKGYHKNMRYLHNQSLHACGIVKGLDVEKKNDSTVTVTGGLALDSNGHEIYMPSDLDVPVNIPGFESQVVYIVISHQDNIEDPDSDEVIDRETKYTRFFERSDPIATTSIPDNLTTIELARVTLDSQGKITLDSQGEIFIDLSNRKKAAITTEQIADQAVTNEKLADNSVDASKIVNGCIARNKLEDWCVNHMKLSTDSVRSVKIEANAVTEAKIANDAVTTVKIADDAVTTVKIADDAVTTDKIADDAVTTDKIADSNITEVKLDEDTQAKLVTGGDDHRHPEKLNGVFVRGSKTISATIAENLVTVIDKNVKGKLVTVRGWASTDSNPIENPGLITSGNEWWSPLPSELQEGWAITYNYSAGIGGFFSFEDLSTTPSTTITIKLNIGETGISFLLGGPTGTTVGYAFQFTWQ